MKAIFALCLLGVASAAVIPLTYNAVPFGVAPQTAGFLPYAGGVITNNPGIFPYTGAALPTTYTGAALPTTYTGAALPTTYTVGASAIPTVGATAFRTVGSPAFQTVSAFPTATYQVAAINPAPGYVAKTLGTEHRAPLPAGSSDYASHHINVANAPGTF